MGRKLGKLAGRLVLMAASLSLVGALPEAGVAQTIFGEESIPTAFDRTFFENEPDFFEQRGLLSQFGFLFSVYLPENRIAEDGRAIDLLYRDLLNQQISSRSVIRTPDLPNPFTGSLLTTPLISEEPLPIAPPPSFSRTVEAAPEPPPALPVEAEPIPALW